MNSICLNFYLVIRAIEGFQLSPLSSSLLYAAAAAWVVWIAIARVYMGMHTPIDVIGGAVTGLFVLLSYLAFDGALPACLELNNSLRPASFWPSGRLSRLTQQSIAAPQWLDTTP